MSSTWLLSLSAQVPFLFTPLHLRYSSVPCNRLLKVVTVCLEYRNNRAFLHESLTRDTRMSVLQVMPFFEFHSCNAGGKQQQQVKGNDVEPATTAKRAPLAPKMKLRCPYCRSWFSRTKARLLCSSCKHCHVCSHLCPSFLDLSSVYCVLDSCCGERVHAEQAPKV